MAYLAVPAGWMSTTMSINRKRLEKPHKIPYRLSTESWLQTKVDSKISRHLQTLFFIIKTKLDNKNGTMTMTASK